MTEQSMEHGTEAGQQKQGLADRIARRLGFVRSSEVEDLISVALSGGGTGVVQDKPYSALVDAYRSWVYTCVDKIGKTVSMLPLHLYVYRSTRGGRKMFPSRSFRVREKTFDTAGERKYWLKEAGLVKEEVLDHPFLDLMNRPNHLMPRMVLWYETVIRLELAGLCGWYLPPNRLGLPAEIWPLPLTRTAELKPVVLPDMTVSKWVYKDGNVQKYLDPDHVILHRYPSPVSPYHGMSPLMAQSYPYDLDLYFMQQQVALYQNKGIPGLHLHTDQNLTKPQVDDALRMLSAQFSGATKSGRPMVTHSGFHADKTGFSPRESMIDEVAKYAREKLITSYDLSEGKVGLVSDVNRANIEALDDTFIKECLRPKCQLIEEVIETFLLPRYDDGLSCDFDLPDTGDKQFRLLERQTNLTVFYSTINEERAKEGMDAVAWGDRPWMSFGLTQSPGLMPPMLPAAPPAGGKDAETETKAVAVGQKERNGAAWMAFTARLTGWENMLSVIFAGHFRQQLQEVTTRLMRIGPRVEAQYAGWSRKAVQQHMAERQTKAGPLDEININPEEAASALRILTAVPVMTVMEAEGNEVLKVLASSARFNVQDPKAVAWLGSRMDLFSQEVTGTTFDEIKAVLRHGFSEGQPLSVIADTLREKFDVFERYRAPLIARTEAQSAMNRSNLFAVEQAGLQERLRKVWLDAGDEATRATHREAGARYARGIPLDEPFVVGGDSMQAPGGGSKAEENISCRCTVSYVQAEDGG